MNLDAYPIFKRFNEQTVIDAVKTKFSDGSSNYNFDGGCMQVCPLGWMLFMEGKNITIWEEGSEFPAHGFPSQDEVAMMVLGLRIHSHLPEDREAEFSEIEAEAAQFIGEWDAARICNLADELGITESDALVAAAFESKKPVEVLA